MTELKVIEVKTVNLGFNKLLSNNSVAGTGGYYHGQEQTQLVRIPQGEKNEDQNISILYKPRQTEAEKQIHFMNLSFNQFAPGLLTSPSGFTCQLGDQKEAFYAIANMGFDSGVITWEIDCPISCQGLQFGIIKHGFQSHLSKLSAYPEKKLISLNTSTPRRVTLELDLQPANRTLKIWLDDMYKETKSIGIKGNKIEPGLWYPMIEISKQGNIASINPFMGDQLRKSSIFDLSLQHLPRPANDEHLILSEQLLEKISQLNAPKAQVDLVVKDHQYIDVMGNMILLEQNKLKLIRRNRDGEFEETAFVNTFQNKPKSIKDHIVFYILRSGIDKKLMKSISWTYLLKNTLIDQQLIEEFASALSQPTIYKNHLFIEIRYLSAKQIINAVMQYLQTYLDYLSPLIENNLSQKDKDVFIDSYIIQIAYNKYIQFLGYYKDIQQLTYEDLIELVYTILSIDEQLFAFTLQEDAGEDFKQQVISSGVHSIHRLYSTFGRLSTFVDQVPLHDPIRLAENGNQFHLIFHKDYSVCLDSKMSQDATQKEMLNQNASQGLNPPRLMNKQSKQCHKQSKQSLRSIICRLWQIGKQFNIPLAQTINSIPYSVINGINHNNYICLELENIQYTFAKTSSLSSPFFTIIDMISGDAQVYNGELAVFKVVAINIRKIPSISQKPVQLVYFLGNDQDQHSKSVLKADKEDQKIQKIQKAKSNSSSSGTEEQKSVQSPQDIAVEPDPDLLNSLYAMGFSVEFCKEALITTKNIGLDQALEAVLQLQEKAVIEAQKKKVEKVVVKQLKMQWFCAVCTFMNEDSSAKCVMCDSDPPEEAYLKEDILEKIEPEAKPQLVEKISSEVDLKKLEEQKKLEEEAQILKEQKQKEEDQIEIQRQQHQEKVSYYQDSNRSIVTQVLQVNISKKIQVITLLDKSSPFSPLVLITTFNPILSQQKQVNGYAKSALLLKKMSFQSNLLSRYSRPVDPNNLEAGFINLLTNELVVDPVSLQNLEKSFLHQEECRKIIQTFQPIFSNGNGKFQNSNIFDSYTLEESEQQLIEFDGESIIFTYGYHLNDTEHRVFVMTKGQDKHCYRIYRLQEKADDAFQLIQSGEFSEPINEVNDIAFIDENFYIASPNKLLIFSPQTNQLKEATKLLDLGQGEVKGVKFFDNMIRVLIIDEKQSRIVTLTSNQTIIKNQSQQVDKNSDVDVSLLNAEEIKSLASLTRNEPIYIKSKSDSANIQDRNTSYYQIHRYRQGRNDIELDLRDPTNLTSLQLEFMFSEHLQAEIQQVQNPKIACLTSFAPRQEEISFMPLQYFHFTGAQYNNMTFISKSLFPVGESFTSNYPRPEYIYTHLQGKQMLIDSYTITSHMLATQKGFPLGGGLIFLSDHPSHFQTSKWDKCTRQDYLDFRQKKLKDSTDFLESDPVGFFELPDSTESGIFTLDVARPAKYVLMKPTMIRGPSQSNYDTGSIEFKFFGIQGQIVEQGDKIQLQQNTSQSQQTHFFSRIQSNIEMYIVDSQLQKKRLELGLENTQVQEENQGNCLENVKYCTKVRLQVQHQELRLNEIYHIQVKLKHLDSLLWWSFSGQKPIQMLDSIVQKISQASQLRRIMSDVDDYPIVNQKIVRQLQNPAADISIRMSCIGLLTQMMANDSKLVSAVYKDLNISSFLRLNVLQITQQQDNMIQNFLNNFTLISDFQTDMLKATLAVLSEIFELNTGLTLKGLQYLVNLVFWVARTQTQQTLPIIFEHLKNIAKLVNQIKQAKPAYHKLESRNTHAEFDHQYFSDYYSNLSQGKSETNDSFDKDLMEEIHQKSQSLSALTQGDIKTQELAQGDKKLIQKDPLEGQNLINECAKECQTSLINITEGQNAPSRMLIITQKHQQQYRIDLYNLYKLNSLSLFMINNSKQAKFRIQLFIATTSNSKKLILDETYGDWTMLQLGALAEKFAADKRFENKSLNELRIPLSNVQARYLELNITFSSNVYSITPLEVPQIPTLLPMFLPEFNGNLIDQSGYNEGLNSQFDNLIVADLKPVKPFLKHGSSLNYAKFTYKNKVFIDSGGQYTGEAEISVPKTRNFKIQSSNKVQSLSSETINRENSRVKSLRSYLENTQSKLSEKLLVDQGSTPVQQLCQTIRKLNIELVKIQPLNPQYFTQSLDFLLTLGYQLADILLNVDELHKSWRGISPLNSSQGMKICQILFQTFIVEETGPINEQVKKLLCNVLLDNLEEHHWVSFIFSQLEKLQTAEDQQISKITENIQQLSIPLPETIAYLATYLNIIPSVQRQPLKQTIIKQLLQLLVQGYKQMPEYQLHPNATKQPLTNYNRGIKREIKNIYVQAQIQTLQPPGTKRSTSSHERETSDELSTIILKEQLDQMSSLKLTYRIVTQLIQQRENYEDQAIQLLLAVLNTTNVRVIRDFLIISCVDQTELNLNDLVLELLSQGTQQYLSYLKSLLEKLFAPKIIPLNLIDQEGQVGQEWTEENKLILLEQKDSLQTCQRIMSFFLFTLIGNYVSLAVGSDSQSILFKQTQNITPLGWLDQITFVSDIYLGWIDTIQKQIKEQKDTSNTQRKRSIQKQQGLVQSIEPTTFKDYQEKIKTDKQCPVCSTQTANLLVSILKKDIQLKIGVNEFYQSTLYWVLLIKIVKRVRSNHLIELRLLEQIMNIYLKDLEEPLQEALYMDILSLTKGLSEQSSNYQIELNSFLLNELISSPKTPLIRGLLAALLPTGQKKCKLNLQVTLALLKQSSIYLTNHCNVGGKDGVLGCPEQLLVKLQLGVSFMKILSEAESQSNTTAIEKLFSHESPITWEEPFQLLINWYVYNYTDTSNSPSSEALKEITLAVQKIFQLVATEEKACTSGLKLMLVSFKDLDKNIVPQSWLQINRRYQIVQVSQQLFEQLFQLWANTSELVNEFCSSQNGFGYLLGKLTQGTKVPNTLKDVVDKEYGNKVTLQNLEGQSCAFNTQDWQASKKGAKSRLFTLPMTGQFQEEYPLVIKLEGTIELKLMRLGFQTYTPDFVDKVFGLPSAIFVEGGIDENSLTPLGSMDLINDEAYAYFGVKVFQLNLFRGLRRSTQIKMIKFRIRRPIISFIEGISQLTGKTFSLVHVAVNFLSILGYDLNATQNIENIFAGVQETTALSVIGQICSPKFDVIKIFANSPQIIAQIINSFQKVYDALKEYEECLLPLLVGLCKYNTDFGDFVLTKLIGLNGLQSAHAKVIESVIIQTQDLQEPRLKRLLDFVLNNIEQSEINNLIQITLLIDVLLGVLHMSSKNLRNQLIQEIPLQVNQLQFDNLVKMYNRHHQLAQSKLLIKLMITVLTLPVPYVIEDQSLKDTLLQSLLNQLNPIKEPYQFQIIAPLLFGSEFVTNWALTQYESWFGEFLVKVENAEKTDQSLFHYFTALSALSKLPQTRQRIIQQNLHILVYQKLRNNKVSTTLEKSLDAETIPLLVNFMGNCSLSSKEQIDHIASLLIDDLKILSKTVDMGFVEGVLLPLLNFEPKVDISIDLWDSVDKLYVSELKQLQSKLDKGEQIVQLQNDENISPTQTINVNDSAFVSKLNSKILQEMHKKHFNEAIKKYGNSLNTFIPDQSWQSVASWSTDGDSGQLDKILKATRSAPFLLLLEGTNGSSGKTAIIGIYCVGSTSQSDISEDETTSKFQIPNKQDNFYFCYEDQGCFHISAQNTSEYYVNTPFGYFYQYTDRNGGLIVLSKNGNDCITISFDEDSGTYIELDYENHKPYETSGSTFNVSEFSFQRGEMWVVPTQPPKSAPKNPLQIFQQIQGQLTVTNLGYGLLTTNLLQSNHLNNNSILAYYSSSPVYQLPESIATQDIKKIFYISQLALKENSTVNLLPNKTISQFKSESFENLAKSHGLITLELDGICLLKDLVPTSAPPFLKYDPTLPVFDSFQAQEGVKKIIGSINIGIHNWKNKEKALIWGQYVEELQAFSTVPAFFSYFLKNQESMELLFQLLAGSPDSSTDKKWEDQEANAVKFIYDTLSNVFQATNNENIRIISVEQNLISKILDRIAMISKEVKRQYVEAIEEEEVESPEPNLVRKESEDYKQKQLKKKKGVGYGSEQTGQNSKWNTQEYIDKKKVRSEQLNSLLSIIKNFFDFTWTLSKRLSQKLTKLVLESALLPLLESAFRSGSLLEMSKEAELNTSFLTLTKVLAKHKSLAPLLMPLPDNYLPKQTESIQILISQLKDVAEIFLKTVSDTTDSVSKDIAQLIISTNQCVQQAIDHYDRGEQQEGQNTLNDTLQQQLDEILSQPLPQAYRLLLKDLRFDYISMKKPDNSYDHHYASNIQSSAIPSSTKLTRLAQEFADMSNALPIDHTNSIFVRGDRDRVDVMKAMVMGAKGTPYGHGAYVFDIFFDDSYPQGPPKVNLSTTGAGKVRFNPNLYSCGKVCLSLLGTWRGHASENWDPKISTLLQILVSSQAIIMCEDVYFNEPGFEGEAGTVEGEKKNEAYSNIVRYCNIKYAMIDNIKNPPLGFEQIIKRHFYLKKDEILEECNKWVKYAEQRDASYTGLVSDHNSHWCTEFKSSKTKYAEMLKEAVKELELVLNSIKTPSVQDLASSKFIHKQRARKVQRKENINDGQLDIEEVDVTYDKQSLIKVLDFADEQVRDRWSRYIGAMGLESVQKQANAQVFISGMGAFGIEIVKNIVLSGVKRLTLHDNKITTNLDLSGQFFLSEDDIGKNRAEASLQKVQQLNYYVRVDLSQCGIALPESASEIELSFPELVSYDIIVLTDFLPLNIIQAWSRFCRKNKVKLIVSSVNGVYARLLNDFGDEFIVVDKNGEEALEVIIKNITNEQQGIVELLQGQRHQFQDGDVVLINNINGMIDKEGKSINGTYHKIKTINKSTFSIEDTSIYNAYQGNGTAKLVKTPLKLSFKPLYEALEASAPPLDDNLRTSDFMKLDNPILAHIAFESLSIFYEKPKFDAQSIELFTAECFKVAKRYLVEEELTKKQDEYEQFFTLFGLTQNAGAFPPLAAFFGGMVSQEIIKSLTNKFTPVMQIYYTDCVEVLPTLPKEKEEQKKFLSGWTKSYEDCKDPRKVMNLMIFGDIICSQLEKVKLFMVGCGAIGCELLKNFAMINIGIDTAGSITITDPDHIESSNLNRQFLFREKHIRKSKSQTAAASVIQMNPRLKGKIVARLDKVFEGTENIYTDQFYESLTIVANALDNIQARRYVDRRCVTAKVPLLESGTLGPKGHVQCIVPFKTESYGSQNDPEEEGEIPYCTLKMFPEETFHCVEFARDKFSKLFTLRAKSVIKLLETKNYQPTTPEETRELKEAVKILENLPSSLADCIGWARNKFEKYFSHDIQQLIYTYPLEHKTKEGKLFWSLPKRPPVPAQFDIENTLHVQFVSTLAYLRANLYGLEVLKDWRSQQHRIEVAKQCETVIVKPWVASEDKKEAISSEVSKQETHKDQAKQQVEQLSEQTVEKTVDLQQELLDKLYKLQGKGAWKIKSEEFEKDVDSNGHIDFIHSFGNLRATNYKLEEMDWLTVKIKAGRIVPALSTTTSIVAGLQTIELCKIIKCNPVDQLKNAFINIAIPYIQLTEPGGVPKVQLTKNISVTLWDRWDVKADNMTLNDFFQYLEQTYELHPVNLFIKSAPIYMHDLHSKQGNEQQKDLLLNTSLIELCSLDQEDVNYCDVIVNFVQVGGNDEIVKNVPNIRISK